MFRKSALSLPIILSFSVFFSLARAHDIPISELRMVPDDSQIHMELRLNIFEFRFISEIDNNKNRRIEKEEFEENKELIKKKILGSLKLQTGREIIKEHSSAITLDESHHVIFRAHYPVNAYQQSLKLVSELQSVTNQSHVTLVNFGNAENNKQLAKLDNRLNSVTFSPLGSSASGIFRNTLLNFRSVALMAVFSLMAVGAFYGLKK